MTDINKRDWRVQPLALFERGSSAMNGRFRHGLCVHARSTARPPVGRGSKTMPVRPWPDCILFGARRMVTLGQRMALGQRREMGQ